MGQRVKDLRKQLQESTTRNNILLASVAQLETDNARLTDNHTRLTNTHENFQHGENQFMNAHAALAVQHEKLVAANAQLTNTNQALAEGNTLMLNEVSICCPSIAPRTHRCTSYKRLKERWDRTLRARYAANFSSALSCKHSRRYNTPFIDHAQNTRVRTHILQRLHRRMAATEMDRRESGTETRVPSSATRGHADISPIRVSARRRILR